MSHSVREFILRLFPQESDFRQSRDAESVLDETNLVRFPVSASDQQEIFLRQGARAIEAGDLDGVFRALARAERVGHRQSLGPNRK